MPSSFISEDNKILIILKFLDVSPATSETQKRLLEVIRFRRKVPTDLSLVERCMKVFDWPFGWGR